MSSEQQIILVEAYAIFVLFGISTVGEPLWTAEFNYDYEEEKRPTNLIREIRLWLISILLLWVAKLLPKDCTKTALWLIKKPFED